MTQLTVDQLIRPQVRALKAYHVADARGYIKLDAMENPYVWPDSMRQAWLERLRSVDVNRYPDPAAHSLSQALRSAGGVPPDAGLLLGNGSDELIQIILMAVAGGDAAILAPEPTFVMYRQIALSLGLRFIGVPLNPADFSLDRTALLSAIEQHQPAVVFLAYPNNPTGNLFERGDIEAVLAAAPGLVVLDEAYAPFTDDTWMNDLARWPNLLVMRTVSKLGLAGLRLGYLAGASQWVDELDKLRLPYNINVLTQVSAEFALAHGAVFAEQTAAIRAERAHMLAALGELAGLHVYPSQANFILFRCLNRPATEVFESLKQQGVLIKNLSAVGGALDQCLRVTVGSPPENQQFLNALSQALR